jgi:tetratricopeptide (TPR) repeat protein
LAAGLLAYANSFQGVFQYDDFGVIVDTARVHSWSAWWSASAHGGLRPLLNLSYAFSWLTGGGAPFAFHVFNLLVHLSNIVLVHALAGLFLRRHDPTHDWRPAALWTALLFAVHPLHSEAVTYLCGRSAALMALFYLAALLAHARGARTLPLGLFLLALLTKESALLLPLALLAWDWSGRISWRLMLRRQWPYWALCVLATLALLLHPAYWSLLWNSVHLRDLHTSAPTQLHSSFALLGELAWPAALNFDPDWPQLDGYATLVPQLALLAASLGLAWHFRGTRPWISLGVVWVLLHLFLANTFFPRADIANERQLYWADWGLLLIVAVEQHLWLSRRASWALALILAGALGTLTLARNSVYTSEVALWQDTARKSPHKARVFNNLGYAYQMAGRKEEARQAYLRALALQPDYVKAGNNLDRLEARPGR